MSSNLPPGVSESMIPGNRPEDDECERFFDWLDMIISSENINHEEAKVIFRAGLACRDTFKELNRTREYVLLNLKDKAEQAVNAFECEKDADHPHDFYYKMQDLIKAVDAAWQVIDA